MTETSYYHVGNERLYPPTSHDDDLSRRSIEEGIQVDEDSYQYSVGSRPYSVDNYDVSQINQNPLYRSNDDEEQDDTEAEKRLKAQINAV